MRTAQWSTIVLLTGLALALVGPDANLVVHTGTQDVSTSSEAGTQGPFGSAAFLLSKPVTVYAGGFGDSELCGILRTAVEAWEYSTDFVFPQSIEDLARNGHILWKLTLLKRAAAESLPVGLIGDAFSEFERKVESALLAQGPRAYLLVPSADPSGKSIRGHMKCVYRRNVSLHAGATAVRSASAENWGPSGRTGIQSNLTPDQWFHVMMLLQLRNGLAYYYSQEKQRAKSRSELANVLGEETSVWQNKELAGIFEEFIRTHRIEEKKSPAPLAP